MPLLILTHRKLWEAYVGLVGCLVVQHVIGYTMLRFKKERFLPLGTDEVHVVVGVCMW